MRPNVKCLFVTTLRKDARQWMGTLPSDLIYSWADLSGKFHARFGSNKRRGKPTGSLAQVRQFSNESLGQYVKRFREAVGQITELNDLQAVGLFQNGLDLVKSEKLVKKLMFNHPKSLAEAFDKAEGYIVVEEAMNSLKRPSSEKAKESDKGKAEIGPKTNGSNNNNRSEGGSRRYSGNWSQGEGRPPVLDQKVNKVYTQLNTDRATILDQIKNQPYFEPPQDNVKPGTGKPGKYCEYHQASGHATNDCRSLKEFIEKKVQSGTLIQYAAGRASSGTAEEQSSCSNGSNSSTNGASY